MSKVHTTKPSSGSAAAKVAARGKIKAKAAVGMQRINTYFTKSTSATDGGGGGGGNPPLGARTPGTKRKTIPGKPKAAASGGGVKLSTKKQKTKKKQKAAASGELSQQQKDHQDWRREHYYGFKPFHTRDLLKIQEFKCPGCDCELQEHGGKNPINFEHKHKIGKFGDSLDGRGPPKMQWISAGTQAVAGDDIDLFFDLSDENKRKAVRSLSCGRDNRCFGLLEPIVQGDTAMQNLRQLQAWRQSATRNRASVMAAAIVANATAVEVARQAAHRALVAGVAHVAAAHIPTCPDCGATYASDRGVAKHRFGTAARCRFNPRKLTRKEIHMEAMAAMAEREKTGQPRAESGGAAAAAAN